MVRHVICAIDTGDLDEALRITKRLSPYVAAFKIGHSLTLPNGIAVVKRLQDAGAGRVFLDLKFHDNPNAVALAVREAARHSVWMMTLHISGGPAMIQAAVEEANQTSVEDRPLLIGVPLLGSMDEHVLNHHLGTPRTLEAHTLALCSLGMDYELDGVGCDPEMVGAVRSVVGHGIVVCRGQRGVVMGASKGADYVLVGRALIDSLDPAAALNSFGFVRPDPIVA